MTTLRLLHHLLLLLTFALLLAFSEKLAFALYHAPLRDGLGLGGLLEVLVWGVRFDLAVAGFFTLLGWLGGWLLCRLLRLPFSRALGWSGGGALAALVALHGGDLLYYTEAGRHLGYELRDTLGSGGELALMAITGTPLPVIAQLLLMAAAAWLFARLLRPAAIERPGLRLELSLPLVVIIATLLLRGGLQSVPLEPLHAQQIGDSRHATLTLNGVYNALFSSVTPYSVEPLLDAPADPQTARARIAALYPAPHAPAEPAKPLPNIVLILLESWTGAYVGSYGYPLPTTPNFDALRAQSLTTLGMLAGGHRTTEGMFATLCSAQNPLGNTVAQTQLQNYPYRCLPHLLRERGYASAFFQGTLTNTSGTGAFANLLGFERNYGRDDIPEHTLPYNNWGLHDADIYRFAIARMQAMPRPFLVGINTNSTHDHRMPEGIEPAFPDADAPTINTLHMADGMLGDFIAEVKATAGLEDTLFVILSDHVGAAPASSYAHYNIPFLIHGPGIPPREVARIASQRDVAPTLLELLGLPAAPWFSGKSLLHDDRGPYYADYYHAGLLGWVEGDRLVTFPLREPNQRSCYQPLTDIELRNPIACNESDARTADDGLLLTQSWQQLLFEGRLSAFAELKGGNNSAQWAAQ